MVVSKWVTTGEASLTDTTEVGADGPPGTNAPLPHALTHGQLHVQEWHPLHDEHDDVRHQKAPCRGTGRERREQEFRFK